MRKTVLVLSLLFCLSAAKSQTNQPVWSFADNKEVVSVSAIENVDTTATDVRVYVEDKSIIIEVSPSRYFEYVITTVQGKLVARGRVTTDRVAHGPLTEGVYLVEVESKTYKVIVS